MERNNNCRSCSATTSWLPWQAKSEDWIVQLQATIAKIRAASHKSRICQLVDNLLSQDCLKVLSYRELIGITQHVKSELIEMSVHNYRYRFVLELLNRATESCMQSLIIEGLLPGVAVLMQNSRGVQIIKECIEIFPNEINQVIYCEIARHICIIAKNPVGQCQVIELIKDLRRFYNNGCILKQIADNAVTLAEDQYGNYVVQKAMDLNIKDLTIDILTQLRGHYSYLSFNKYGSHVVEKCLRISYEEHREEIVQELLQSPNISTLLSDIYGNFVIQRVWEVSQYWEGIHEELALVIQQHASELRGDPYGRGVFNKLRFCRRRRCPHLRE